MASAKQLKAWLASAKKNATEANKKVKKLEGELKKALAKEKADAAKKKTASKKKAAPRKKAASKKGCAKKKGCKK